MLEAEGPAWIRNCLAARGFKPEICKVWRPFYFFFFWAPNDLYMQISNVPGLPYGVLATQLTFFLHPVRVLLHQKTQGICRCPGL